MIDLHEPATIAYSSEEKRKLKEDFLILLHTLLLIYLALHNLILPVIINLAHDQHLLTDIHFWFLFHLPVQWLLRKRLQLPEGVVLFLAFGSMLRLGVELYLSTSWKGWGTLSLLLSELSSFIFYFVYYPFCHKRKYLWVSLLALLVTPSLSWLEIRSQKIISSSIVHKELGTKSEELLGCKGSTVGLEFPLTLAGGPRSSFKLIHCGFEEQLIRSHSHLAVTNSLAYPVNLRLYKLQVLHGKVKWKFVRLVRLKNQESWELSEYVRKDVAYLLKSPERRKLGHAVIIPERTRDFPLGKGRLNLHYDSLEWIRHE